MKKIFLITLILFSACSSLKNTKNKAENPTLNQVKLTLYEKPSNFIWERGSYLNLKGKISNNSQDTIVLIAPKKNKESYPEVFKVNISEEFKGTSCEFEIGEDKFIDHNGFWKIPPNTEKEFQISGNNYFLNYCNDESNGIDNITVFIQYKGKVYNYTTDSYFIKTNYNSQLSEKEITEIDNRVESFIKKRYAKLNEIEKEKKRELFKQSFMKGKIDCTPKEQKEIINLFNNSINRGVNSNTITIAVEK